MTTLAQTDTDVAVPPAGRIRIMTSLVWLTTVAIFCQAVIAGLFVSQDGRDSWITVHGVIADVSWVLTLGCAAYAWFALRDHFPNLARASIVLFVATLAQTGIGHLITDYGVDWLIAIHVPLAFVVFGFAGYLSIWAIRVRRQHAAGVLHHASRLGVEPRADVGHVTAPVVPAADQTDPHRAG